MSLIEVDSEPDEPDHLIVDRETIVLIVTSTMVLVAAVAVGIFLG